MRAFLLLVCAAAGAAMASAQCSGTPNNNPVYTGEPVFVGQTLNGKRYTVGPATMSPQLTVLHVYGTSYQMGVAYGTLMRKEITTLVPEFYQYAYSQIAPYIQFLPADVQKEVEEWGIEFALNLTYALTAPYIPSHYTDMVAGMANATGIDYNTLIHVSLFPELIRMGCTMFGAWGPATAQTSSGLVQLRALDWGTDGPFQQFPVVVVYHPNAGDGNTFASMSWAGLVGSITGYAATQVAISEKVWLNYNGQSSMTGIPATFLLEDILRWDMDTDQALSRIASANRTCSIFIGIGDKFNNQFRAVEYSHQQVSIFNDRNFPSYPNHDLFEGLVFIDKHTQPSSNPCLNTLLHKYYGNIDPMVTLQYITSVFQTGNMHIAIYDFANSLMFVSNALPPNATGYISNAYDNTFIRLNMTELWAVSQ